MVEAAIVEASVETPVEEMVSAADEEITADEEAIVAADVVASEEVAMTVLGLSTSTTKRPSLPWVKAHHHLLKINTFPLRRYLGCSEYLCTLLSCCMEYRANVCVCFMVVGEHALHFP